MKSLLLKVVAGAFILLLIPVLCVIFINRKDQPPSKDATEMQRIVEGAKPVPDLENAYVYATGLSSPDDADAGTVGVERIETLRKFFSSAGPLDLPQVNVQERESPEKRNPDLKKLANLCSDSNRVCAEELDRDAKRIQDWVDQEAKLIIRYERLLEFGQWREIWPSDPRFPFAGFVYTVEAQQLMLLKAWLAAGRGDYGSCRRMLERDLRFWRMTLAESSNSVDKLMAARAIELHFAMGNLVLRRLPLSVARKAMPAEWEEPMSLRERSIARIMASEWTFFNQNFAAAAKYGRMTAEDQKSGLGNLATKLSARFLLKPQATSNAIAERMMGIASLFNQAYSDIPRSAEALLASERFARKDITELGIYNFQGEQFIDSINMESYLEYGYRVADLEGIRRATVLAAQFRFNGLDAGKVEDGLRKASLRDPYDGNAFGWIATENVIVFRRTPSGAPDLEIAY